MEIIYFVGFMGWIVASLKWGDWKHIEKYQSSIYLLMIGSLLYSYLTATHLLWKFESPYFHLKHSFIDLILVFVVFPCIVVIFLSHYPKGWIKQMFYNLSWACLLIFHEWIARELGVLSHHDGWSIWWSFLVDLIFFPLLRLNQKKPFLAYFLLLGITSLFFMRFGNIESLP